MKEQRPKPKRVSSTNTFQYKMCLWCGNLQGLSDSFCEKCQAGAIGLGKPYAVFAYIDLKVESRLTMYPDSPQFKRAIHALATKMDPTPEPKNGSSSNQGNPGR